MISGRYRFAAACRRRAGRIRPSHPARHSGRAAAAHQLGPRPQSPARPARQPAPGPDQRRHHSRHRPVRRLHRHRRPHRRAGRGVRLRAPRRRHVPARHQRLAAGADRGRPRPRHRRRRAQPALVPFWRGEERRPQLRPRPGHRRTSCASWPHGSSSPICLDLAAARVSTSMPPPPATCAITSAAQIAARPAACRPIARCSSRRRAISSATGRCCCSVRSAGGCT